MKLPPIPKQSIKNLVIVYLGAAVNAVSLFLVNAILIRTIDTDAYGAFTLAVLTLTTLAEMSDLGLNGAITRFVPQYKAQGDVAKLRAVIDLVYRWRVWLSAGITIGGVFLAPIIAQVVFGQPAIANALRIGFVGVGGVVLLGFISTYLKATEQFVTNTIIQVCKGVGRVIAVLLLAATVAPTSPMLYIGVFVVVPWLLVPIFWHTLPKRSSDNQLTQEEKHRLKKDIASFSGWLVVWSFAAIIGTRVDQIMLSNMLSLEAVAIYAYGFQFVFAYSFLQQAFSAIIAPKMNAMRSVPELREFIKHAYQWLIPGVAGVIVLTLFVVIIGERWLFPGEYIASLPVFYVIIASLLINLLFSPYSQVITVYKKTNLVAFSGIMGFLINVIGNAIFIPKIGIIGAVMTLLMSSILTSGVIYVLAKRQLTREFHPS